MIMKRIISYLSIPVLGLLGAACATQEPIEFAHESRAFDPRSNMILVEGIMPQASTQDEEIYIIGAFNGGEAAIGNPDYLMIHSEVITSKWGVYLDPSRFQGGKTLADGFTFYSVQQGIERGPKNEDVEHKLNIGVGTGPMSMWTSGPSTSPRRRIRTRSSCPNMRAYACISSTRPAGMPSPCTSGVT